jgi:hypothetical protein
MPKKIIAWVNKTDKKKLEKLANNIYFAISLEDFETNLSSDCMPVFSLSLAASTFEKTRAITKAHPEIEFYFLEKVRIDVPLTANEMSLRWDDNCQSEAKWACCVVALAQGNLEKCC